MLSKDAISAIIEHDNHSKKMVDIDRTLSALRIDPNAEIPPPPVILSYRPGSGKTSPLLTLGNFSLLIGKAKSRKTFLVTAIAAASISGHCGIDGLDGTLAEEGIVVLVDTEQAPFHVQRMARRICQQTGQENPPNLQIYAARPLRPSEILQVIEHLITNTPGLKLLIIDGVKDLLSRGINDEAESIELIRKILKWTHDYAIHILLVLHQNKNDLNARGHIGTEAVNKAETVLSVQRHEKEKEFTVVYPEYCRDIDFEPFIFFINGLGLPESAENIPLKESKSEIKKNAFTRIMPGMITLSYKELKECYAEHAGVSTRTASRHIADALSMGMIAKQSNGFYKCLIQNEQAEEPPF